MEYHETPQERRLALAPMRARQGVAFVGLAMLANAGGIGLVILVDLLWRRWRERRPTASAAVQPACHAAMHERAPFAEWAVTVVAAVRQADTSPSADQTGDWVVVVVDEEHHGASNTPRELTYRLRALDERHRYQEAPRWFDEPLAPGDGHWFEQVLADHGVTTEALRDYTRRFLPGQRRRRALRFWIRPSSRRLALEMRQPPDIDHHQYREVVTTVELTTVTASAPVGGAP
ncbi:MAG: hypothetical protein IT340_22045 [Chloroflexi bacterium]|nr:hypothetical protein [Chloroflexota bacterium]